MKSFRFFSVLLWENRWWYLAGTCALMATMWMSLAIPHLLQQAVDVLGRNPDPNDPSFRQAIQQILLFAVVIIFTRTFSRQMFFTPGRKVEYHLKNRLLAHLATLQRDYFSQNPTGAIISRINNDINGIRMTMGFGLLQLANAVATLSLAPYYMYRISPQLTLYCALPIGVGFVLLQLGVRRMRKEQVEQQSALQHLSDFIVESYNGIEVLKGYRAFAWNEATFDRINRQVTQTQVRLSNIRAFFMPVLAHMVNGLKVMLVLVGGVMVIQNQMTMGNFLAYLMYLTMLVPPLMGMTWMMFVLQRGFTSLESLATIFETQPNLPPPDAAVVKAEKALPPQLVQGLRVQHLSFAYPDNPEQPVLQDVSFTIAPGEIVGVFGPVGAGKTTLVNLLSRYLPVAPHCLFWDGVDAGRMELDAHRRRVVCVTQDPFLFSDTVRENILFGAGEVTEFRLMEVVRAAALTPDLERFPQGLDTLVGEKGITLSGGQKQRIALARAMMKPTELLILDDPLSAVDHETERLLTQAIYGFQHSRSLLIVSHRVSVLERAQRIVVLEGGRVTQVATHEELIRREGSYRTAWLLQSQSAQNPAHTQGHSLELNPEQA